MACVGNKVLTSGESQIHIHFFFPLGTSLKVTAALPIDVQSLASVEVNI